METQKVPARAIFEYRNWAKFKSLIEQKIWWGGPEFQVNLGGRPATTATAAEAFNARYPGANVDADDFYDEPFVTTAPVRQGSPK